MTRRFNAREQKILGEVFAEIKRRMPNKDAQTSLLSGSDVENETEEERRKRFFESYEEYRRHMIDDLGWPSRLISTAETAWGVHRVSMSDAFNVAMMSTNQQQS